MIRLTGIVDEITCSKEFYHCIKKYSKAFPLKVEPISLDRTKIEQEEKVDTAYVCKRLDDLKGEKVKALLIQEKAPHYISKREIFSFELKKDQHDRLLLNQSKFKEKGYFYGFFAINRRSLPFILARTVHLYVKKIPNFFNNTKTVKVDLGFIVNLANHNWTGYHILELFMKTLRCHVGIPSKHFPMLSDDLVSLIEETRNLLILLIELEKRDAEFYLWDGEMWESSQGWFGRRLETRK